MGHLHGFSLDVLSSTTNAVGRYCYAVRLRVNPTIDILTQLNKICDQDAYLELQPQSKIPVASDWPNQGKHLDDVISANGNLGLILRLTSSILDIDLDCMEAKALADVILPAPHAVFDKGSKDSGHYLYQASSFGPRKTFNTEGAKSTFVELRGDGCQTMIPPSIHPNGGTLAFMSFDKEATEVQYDYLLESVNFLAACSEVAQNWGDGHRHSLALAFSGLCLKEGIEPNLIMHIVHRICEITGNHEVDDRLNAIRTSYAKPADSLLGYKGLLDCLGQEKAKRIADRIAAYTGRELS